MFSRYRLLILGTFVWVVLDQWTKVAMVKWLVPGDLPPSAGMIRSEVYDVSESWFRLRVVGNPGAAWGIFRSIPDWARVPFFVLMTSVALYFLFRFYRQTRPDQRAYKVALMCICGGAIGNLIDRIRYGYVVDFVEWFYGDFRWPNFNVADIAISVGAGLLALELLFEKKHEDAPPATNAPPSTDAPPGPSA